MRVFEDPLVKSKFLTWETGARLLGEKLRSVIFDRADILDGVGPIFETLKWNQPAYLTAKTGAGSTIRMDEIAGEKKFGLYFHCQTSLVETFRSHYGRQLEFQKNRAVLIDLEREPPMEILTHCIDLALTYHLKK